MCNRKAYAPPSISAATKPQWRRPMAMRPARVMSYFTSLYGLPPSANLTMIETEAGAPTGYAAPGMIFLSPGTIGNRANSKAASPMRWAANGGKNWCRPLPAITFGLKTEWPPIPNCYGPNMPSVKAPWRRSSTMKWWAR